MTEPLRDKNGRWLPNTVSPNPKGNPSSLNPSRGGQLAGKAAPLREVLESFGGVELRDGKTRLEILAEHIWNLATDFETEHNGRKIEIKDVSQYSSVSAFLLKALGVDDLTFISQNIQIEVRDYRERMIEAGLLDEDTIDGDIIDTSDTSG